MSTGYDIRYNILAQAKDMLFEKWHKAMDLEEIAADLEKRPPKLIPPPTVDEIKATAESLYDFVQKK